MSTQTQHREETESDQNHPTRVECRYRSCRNHGYKWEFHHGKYCSNSCEIKARGRDALEDCRDDHTRCFTCLKKLKDVEPPKPDFEFVEKGHAWTRNEETGEPKLEFYSQEVTADAACGYQYGTQWATDGEKQRAELVVTAIICGACGNTNHSHHEPGLGGREAIGRLISLLYDTDEISVDSEHELHRAYETTRDIDLAVGLAVSEDD